MSDALLPRNATGPHWSSGAVVLDSESECTHTCVYSSCCFHIWLYMANSYTRYVLLWLFPKQELDKSLAAFHLVIARLVRTFYAWSLFVEPSKAQSAAGGDAAKWTPKNVHLRFNEVALSAIRESLALALGFIKQCAFFSARCSPRAHSYFLNQSYFYFSKSIFAHSWRSCRQAQFCERMQHGQARRHHHVS